MTTAQIIAMARSQTGTDTSNYPDALAIQHLNFVYQDITSSIITDIDEDYYFDIAKWDTVVNQEEYTIDSIVRNSASKKINEINNVYIKYWTDDTYYTKATRVNPTQLPYDMDYYKVSQSKYDPIFFIQDKSVFIYPAPDVEVTDWLKLNVIYQPWDLTTSSTETDIEISFRFHKVIVAGLLPYIYAYRQQMDVEQVKQALYQQMKREMIAQIKNRNQTTVQILPND